MIRSFTLVGKHVFDPPLALVLLILLSPVLLLLALLVRWRIGRPVLFRQVRPGRGGAPFTIYKFRTMTQTCGSDGMLLPDADRLTGLGRFLRRTSLDELPELINVLRGDMCFVGPRPLLMEYLDLYSPEQARRNQVKPGITGWAQVNGRNAIDWDTKFHFDTWYVDQVSPWLDAWILLLTVANLLRGSDISHAGHATMPRFEGNAPMDREPDA